MKGLHGPTLFLVFTLTVITSMAKELKSPKVADLTAADGIGLKVSYFSAGKPGPGVLLLHQCNRQRKIWDGLALQLVEAGINVLTLDLRGFGESGGDRQDKLTVEEARAAQAKWPGDIDVAFQFLKSQPGVNSDAIGVGGASCGVNNSIQAARRHPEVKSLVLLSGTTDLEGRQFLRQPGSVPVLFAVADDDEFPPSVQMIEWLYNLDSNPGKRLLHYAIGGHGADMFPFHPELQRTIVEWYVTTLIKTPGRAPAAKDTSPVSPEIKVLDSVDQLGGAEKVALMLADARKRDRKTVLFPEAVVNVIGYEHIQAGDIKGAVEILKLNVTAFPDSPNAYDSLGTLISQMGRRN